MSVFVSFAPISELDQYGDLQTKHETASRKNYEAKLEIRDLFQATGNSCSCQSAVLTRLSGQRTRDGRWYQE